MIVKNLGGHSGCKIFLCEKDNKYFVRKYSSSIKYNSRLEAQCEKQKNFKSSIIKTPKVLGQGYEEGIFFFDMEYLQGITLAKYITKVDVSEIQGIVDLLIRNIDFQGGEDTDVSKFQKKTNDLKLEIGDTKNGILNDALEYLSGVDWTPFYRGVCHGDLTLENIIIKNGEIYFIDFLDSFYDSCLLDFGKLLQDVECMWSFRNGTIDTNIRLRLVIFKDILLEKLANVDKRIIDYAYKALLLDLVRIYPYAKENKTIEFLNSQVEKVLNKVRGGRI